MSLTERLARAFLQQHPPEAAATLERMSNGRRVAAIRAMRADVAPAMAHMNASSAAEALTALASEDAAPILLRLPIDTAVGLLRRLQPEAVERVTAVLPDQDRDAMTRVLRYPEGTAGALMDPTVFTLPDDAVAGDARARLRRDGRNLLHYLFVVDRAGVLAGVIEMPALLHAPARLPVRDLMQTPVHAVPAWTPAAAVRTHPGWRTAHAMAVTDEGARLLGVIRYETMKRLEQELGARRGDTATTQTVGALGELFHLGMAGMIEGVAAAASTRDGRAESAAASTGAPGESTRGAR